MSHKLAAVLQAYASSDEDDEKHEIIDETNNQKQNQNQNPNQGDNKIQIQNQDKSNLNQKNSTHKSPSDSAHIDNLTAEQNSIHSSASKNHIECDNDETINSSIHANISAVEALRRLNVDDLIITQLKSTSQSVNQNQNQSQNETQPHLKRIATLLAHKRQNNVDLFKRLNQLAELHKPGCSNRIAQFKGCKPFVSLLSTSSTSSDSNSCKDWSQLGIDLQIDCLAYQEHQIRLRRQKRKHIEFVESTPQATTQSPQSNATNPATRSTSEALASSNSSAFVSVPSVKLPVKISAIASEPNSNQSTSSTAQTTSIRTAPRISRWQPAAQPASVAQPTTQSKDLETLLQSPNNSASAASHPNSTNKIVNSSSALPLKSATNSAHDAASNAPSIATAQAVAALLAQANAQNVAQTTSTLSLPSQNFSYCI
jgi:hypothetical protein